MFRKRPTTYRLIAVPDAYGIYEVTVAQIPGLHFQGRNLSDVMAAVRRDLSEKTGVPAPQIQLSVDVKAVGTRVGSSTRKQRGAKPKSAA